MEKKLFRSLLLLITFAVVLVLLVVRFEAIWGLVSYILAMLKPLFIGIAIAFVLDRPCTLCKKGLGALLGGGKLEPLVTPLAVTSAYLLLFGGIASLFAFVIPQLVESIETFISNIGGYGVQLQSWFDWLFHHFNIESMDIDMGQVNEMLQQLLNNALTILSDTLPHVMSMTTSFFSGLVTLLLAFVFSVYLLAGKERLLGQSSRVLKAYLPPKLYTKVAQVARLTGSTFSEYISGELMESCILGGLCFLGMTIFGFHYAPLISVIVGVGAIIPIMGAYASATISVLLLILISPAEAFWFVVFLVTLQQIEGNFIYPRVVGGSIGLPGIWVLISVTIGGGLFDLIGILLAVPVASIVYTLVQKDVRKKLSRKRQAI